MRTVEDFARIRQLQRDGLTIREIAAQLHHSSKTILKALSQAEPTPYQRTEPRPAPVFGPFRSLVDAILQADQTAPRKQRHTAAQIHRRLVAEHGYTGGYDQIRRYLQEQRLQARETFIPLEHPPGARAEADFGHIAVDFPTGRQSVAVLLVTWSYSNAPFAIALPTERTEAILHGLAEAFTFFGAVPRELWWDNPKTVAIHILQGRQRTLHPRYTALVSHYCLTPKFCLPATATEKPRVENRVFDLQRQWATPVPVAAGFADLNAHLLRCALAARERTCGTNTETVAARWEQDRSAALALPPQRFDACVFQPGQVDKYQTVGFDGNRYSVPRRHAFRTVTVKGYIDQVAVIADGQEVARHPRHYGRHEKVLNPLHFLVALERKPAALDHAPVYRDWHLPPAFAALRADLEKRLGPSAGTRQYISVLQLLATHPIERVQQAIEQNATAELARIRATVERLAMAPPVSFVTPSVDSGLSPSVEAALAAVTVPRPDLAQFNRLLFSTPQGEETHAGHALAVAQGQPQAAQAPHDAGRVRETRP